MVAQEYPDWACRVAKIAKSPTVTLGLGLDGAGGGGGYSAHGMKDSVQLNHCVG